MNECGVCKAIQALEPLYDDDLWAVRPIEEPAGVAGWMILVAKRHVAGPAYFDDREAATFGPMLRHCERVLEKVTGALRIYTAALGEAHPHFHAHMVPRYQDGPKGWALFDQQRAAKAGEIRVEPAEVARIIREYKLALVKEPFPR